MRSVNRYPKLGLSQFLSYLLSPQQSNYVKESRFFCYLFQFDIPTRLRGFFYMPLLSRFLSLIPITVINNASIRQN